jgi:hypothetical protein
MLYFPNPAKRTVWEKLQQFPSLMTPSQAQQMAYGYGQKRSGVSFGPGVKGAEDVLEGTRAMPAPVAEVTHGNQIRQQVVMPINDPGLWQPAPSAVIVCWPISVNDLAEYNRPAEVRQGQVGFTF